MTINDLKAFGADTDDGVARCAGNEAFYIRMVAKAARDGAYDELSGALDRGDADAAFNACHKLKGFLANLSLTPILDPVIALTEKLRPRVPLDSRPHELDEIMKKRGELLALLEK